MYMELNFKALEEVLPEIGLGIISIFIVTAIIILITMLLNKLTEKKQ